MYTPRANCGTSHTALLLDKEPSNLQAQSLATLIDKRVTRGACSCSFTHPISLIHSPLLSPPCRGIYRNGNCRGSGGGQHAPPSLRHTASIPQITPFAGARLTSVPRPLYRSICQCRCSFHSHTMVNDELSCPWFTAPSMPSATALTLV